MDNWKGRHYDIYRSFCYEASINDEVYAGFKSRPEYKPILEHVSQAQGLQFLQKIKSYGTIYSQQNFDKFKLSDKIGAPDTFCQTDFGAVSASTLRYISVLCDLVFHFGDLSGLHIVEVGGGYGGQIKIINDVFDDVTFTTIDLSEAISLQKRYLSDFDITADFISAEAFCAGTDSIDGDLVISNYAISEVTLSNQVSYTEKLLCYAKRGFLICNGGRGERKNRTSEDWEASLAKIQKEVLVFPETPQTGGSNKVFVWKG